MFWDNSANAWAAVGSMIQAAGTIVLFIVAVTQLRSIKRENLKTRTLAACDKYDTDPVLDSSLRKLRTAFNAGLSLQDRIHLHTSAATVCNYLDSIAVGVAQELYIEALVRDHLKSIVIKHVDDYLVDDSVARAVGMDRKHYTALIAMAAKWNSDEVSYRDGGFVSRIKQWRIQ